MSDLDIALAWLRAAGARDLIGLLALSDPEITLFGVLKRPAVRGNDVLRQWFGKTELNVVPHMAYVLRDRVLVIDARGATVLGVAGGLVTSFLREEGPDPVRRHGFRGAEEIVLEIVA